MITKKYLKFNMINNMINNVIYNNNSWINYYILLYNKVLKYKIKILKLIFIN